MPCPSLAFAGCAGEPLGQVDRAIAALVAGLPRRRASPTRPSASADDSVKPLREGASADARAKAAEYPGGCEHPHAIEALIAAGYRLSPDEASTCEKALAGKPAVLALVRKSARK